MSSVAPSYAPIGGAEEAQEASSAPSPPSWPSDPFDTSQVIDFLEAMIAWEDAETARIAGEIAIVEARRRRRSDA